MSRRPAHTLTQEELEEALGLAEPFSPEQTELLLEESWRVHRPCLAEMESRP